MLEWTLLCPNGRSMSRLVVGGQGGLFEVAVHPNYKDNGWIYISYSGPGDGGHGTELEIDGRKGEGKDVRIILHKVAATGLTRSRTSPRVQEVTSWMFETCSSAIRWAPRILLSSCNYSKMRAIQQLASIATA